MMQRCDDADIPEYFQKTTTWNPWHGCHRVSEGCRNCYMFLGNEARGVPGSDMVMLSKTQFDLPLKRNRDGGYMLRDKLVMTSMTGDFFIEEADGWRDDAWDIIRRRRDLTFEILTKRPHRIMDCLPRDWDGGYPNVRLSVSAEDQRSWDERVNMLMDIPSRKRDVFLAPMIGEVDAEPLLSKKMIDCVYLGGEYGGKPRPCDMRWVESVRDSCVRNGVSFFWRNCGELVIDGGQMIHLSSIREQEAFCRNRPMDHIVDDPLPKSMQTTLF